MHGLRDLYDAEHRFLKSQAQIVYRTPDLDLQSSIESHIYQTRQHIRNLEQFFKEVGQESRRGTNEATEAAQGLANEAQEGIEGAGSDVLRDCVIDAAIVKVEHFEIGGYRSLISEARLMMGQSTVVDNLLRTNLRQEERAQIAEQSPEELLQKVLQAEQPEEKGLIDKVKKLKDIS